MSYTQARLNGDWHSLDDTAQVLKLRGRSCHILLASALSLLRLRLDHLRRKKLDLLHEHLFGIFGCLPRGLRMRIREQEGQEPGQVAQNPNSQPTGPDIPGLTVPSGRQS